jgi:hypothetical protein
MREPIATAPAMASSSPLRRKPHGRLKAQVPISRGVPTQCRIPATQQSL